MIGKRMRDLFFRVRTASFGSHRKLLRKAGLRAFAVLILVTICQGCFFGGSRSGLKVDLGDSKEKVRNEYGAGDRNENSYGRLGLYFYYNEKGGIRIISANFTAYGDFKGELEGISLGMPLETAISRLGQPLERFGYRDQPGSENNFVVWKLGTSRYLFVYLFESDSHYDGKRFWGVDESPPPGLRVFRKGSIFEIKLCDFRCEYFD
jgi:hypothetical protein